MFNRKAGKRMATLLLGSALGASLAASSAACFTLPHARAQFNQAHSDPAESDQARSFKILFGYDGDDAPGGPESLGTISRRLLEEGYELRTPIIQNGPVYFANGVKDGQAYCLILDIFTGTILQKFEFTPTGLHALIASAPGPGFPGHPPFPDGRYASSCYVGMPPAPPAAPPPPPKPHIVHVVRRHRIKHKPLPLCRPVEAPKKAVESKAAESKTAESSIRLTGAKPPLLTGAAPPPAPEAGFCPKPPNTK